MTVINSLKNSALQVVEFFGLPIFLVLFPVVVVIRALYFIAVDVPGYIFKSISKRTPVQKN